MNALLLHAGYSTLAGVDEAGRGPWAGPVVAGAVLLPWDFPRKLLKDSKRLTARQRGEALGALSGDPRVIWAVASASVHEVDSHNILQATFLAMRRAVDKLSRSPLYLLVDGRDFPFSDKSGRAVVSGDTFIASISAASIVAKEHRDRLMQELAIKYPEYGFERHQGYGTVAHQKALERHGPCPEHRRSFSPIRRLLEKGVSPDIGSSFGRLG